MPCLDTLQKKKNNSEKEKIKDWLGSQDQTEKVGLVMDSVALMCIAYSVSVR